MSSINKVILIGNTGKDPEIRIFQGGKSATLSICTSETWTDKKSGEKKTLSQWHTVVVFQENYVDFIEKYIKKGDRIYVEGQIKYRKYEDQNGNEKNICEVVISNFKGDIKKLNTNQEVTTKVSPSYTAVKIENNPGTFLEDEIPF